MLLDQLDRTGLAKGVVPNNSSLVARTGLTKGVVPINSSLVAAVEYYTYHY